jgi:ABC-type glutathione transport system ATPase component
MSVMGTAILAEGCPSASVTCRPLAGLDLAVARSEVLGYLGPDGAGKTTTIRLLLGWCGRRRTEPGSSAWTCSGTRWRRTGGWPMSAGRPACGRR